MKLFASPWAPPYWMTEQNTTLHNPTLKGGPTSPTAQIYADYLMEFFRRYSKKYSIECNQKFFFSFSFLFSFFFFLNKHDCDSNVKNVQILTT
jgi:hypothetical protein